MQKIILISVLLLSGIPQTFSQNTAKEKNDAMQIKVAKYFNMQNADSLYGLTGTAFKKQLSAENFKTICTNNLFPLGNLKWAEFEKIEKGVSKYKTTFDKAILSMYISLDSLGMLKAFLFKPYQKELTGTVIKTQTDNKLITDLDKKLDSLVQSFMWQSKTVGLSIGILKNGKSYFYNYGQTKKDNHQLPTANNLYEIGSITKTFTGLLLAKAIVENKIALTDAVNKYLPKNIPTIKLGNDTLKIIQLANHTSGLPRLPDNFDDPNLINPYKNYDTTKLYAYLKNAKLLHRPGLQFEYSNLAVGLLGNILERIYNMPFEKMVTHFICSAAGMNATKQFITPTDSALFVQGYDDSILPQSQWDFKALAPAGCLRSTTTDMLKYAQLNFGAKDTLLSKAIELSHQPTFNAGQQQIAMNWFIQNWGWGNIIFHSGQTHAFKSFLALNNATKNAVVILSNTAINNDELGVNILQFLDK